MTSAMSTLCSADTPKQETCTCDVCLLTYSLWQRLCQARRINLACGRGCCCCVKLRCRPIVVPCSLAVTVLPSAAVPAGLPVTGQPWESGLCKGTASVMHCAATLLSASWSAAAVINCAAGLLLASCSVAMTVPPSAAVPAAGLPVTCQTSESGLLKGQYCHHTLHCHPAVSVLLSSCCNTLCCQPVSSLLSCCDGSVISCCASMRC